MDTLSPYPQASFTKSLPQRELKKQLSSISVNKGRLTPLANKKKLNLDNNATPFRDYLEPASPARSAQPNYNRKISYSALMEQKQFKRVKTMKKDKRPTSNLRLQEAIGILKKEHE